MRPIWKTVLRLAVDAAATIGFFYTAVKPAALAAGVTVASAIYAVSSIFPALGPHISLTDGSFLTSALLSAWMAVYMVLIFAIAMEITRRLVGDESLRTYLVPAALGVPIALVLVSLAVFVRDGTEGFGFQATDAVAAAILILAGAAGGTVYWLITVKLRAVLSLLLSRLICGAEPRATSCAFS